MFALWFASILSPAFKNCLEINKNCMFLIDIINYINDSDWINARKVWIFNVIKKIPINVNGKIEYFKTLPLEKRIVIDFFGSEYQS